MRRVTEQMITFVIVVGIISIILLILSMRCPNCKQWGGKEIIAEKTYIQSGLFRNSTWTLISYRCKYCEHVWSEERGDNDYRYG